jgi:hypothetical protein
MIFCRTMPSVIPGHGRITNKAGIKYTIDYVEELEKRSRGGGR